MGTLVDSTPAMLLEDYIRGGWASEFTGWTFKVGKLPPEPDQCITIIDSGGAPSFPHLLVDYVSIQVLVRGGRAADGYVKSRLVMSKVRDILLGCKGKPAEFSELDGITERSNIVALGYDDQDRHVWSWNIRLIVEPNANALTNRESL